MKSYLKKQVSKVCQNFEAYFLIVLLSVKLVLNSNTKFIPYLLKVVP